MIGVNHTKPTEPADAGYHDQPMSRGYTAPSHLRPAIAAAHRSRMWRTCLAALADHGVVYALVIGAAWTMLHGPAVLGALAAVVAVVGTARELRALENLIHEGSHYNWNRVHRMVNDRLALVLCGLPTGVRIPHYRASHLRHHGRFGTADDPDRRRYVELDIESIARTTRWAFTIAGLGRLVAYERGWLRELRTSPRFLAVPLAWALVMIGLPAGLAFGLPAGVIAAALWILGWVLALPALRFLGESSEHVYLGSDSVFDATISNLGFLQRVMIHPHNDGYHTVHHMWPGVPHHALRRLHNLLVVEDPENYARRLRYRTRVVQDPRRGLGPAPGGGGDLT